MEDADEPRVIVVSNRLPVMICEDELGQFDVRPSSGGLATALSCVHGRPLSKSVWIGWPGPVYARAEMLPELLSPLRCVGVLLTPTEVASFYENFSNGVLWPLCHYLLDKVAMDVQEDWATFVNVSQRFADAVASVWASPSDVVWIHDYQLMLVPSMVRLLRPAARIGYFHHIPFPAVDVFRVIPWRSALLEGVLGADVVGFHTASYAQNFGYSCASVLGVEARPESLTVDGRRVQVGAFPIGIDAEAFARRAASVDVTTRVCELRAETEDRRFVLSVDRLDYTKGIVCRLLSIERMLSLHPELIGKLHFVQLAVPTRESVDAYAAYRASVNELVGRINGRFSSATRTIVHFLHRSVTAIELSALFCAADVMMVTPLRDGMNLVAKEYVASRLDGSGVLVLSEFAGAAVQLHGALVVNPYDLECTAERLREAMSMPLELQRARMATLRKAVFGFQVGDWARSFIRSVASVAPVPHVVDLPLMAEVTALIRAPHVVMFLDYDGTLVELKPTPMEAVPSVFLNDLLKRLCSRESTEVHIVSGRTRDFLSTHLGGVHRDIYLHAEHGLFSRVPGCEWELQPGLVIPPPWLASVREVMQRVSDATDGAWLEEKAASIAFHFRATEPMLAELRISELVSLLEALHPDQCGFELLKGSKVLEARIRGVSKALAVRRTSIAENSGCLVAGDDVTDEDMFSCFSPKCISIHVGAGSTQARFRLPHVKAMLSLLSNIANDAPTPSFKKKDF